MSVPEFKARVAALYGEPVLSKSALRIRDGRCGAVLLHDYAPDNATGLLVQSLPPHEVEIMDDIFAFWRAK